MKIDGAKRTKIAYIIFYKLKEVVNKNDKSFLEKLFCSNSEPTITWDDIYNTADEILKELEIELEDQ